MERLLKISEVAEMAQVSDKTVRRWVDKGLLAAVVVGGVIRFRPGAYDEMIMRCEQRPEQGRKAPVVITGMKGRREDLFEADGR